MNADLPGSGRPFDDLVDLVASLRAEDGCPWDRAQTARSMRQYVIEEAFEVVEALDARDDDRLRDELGDLLFQIVFQARVAAEEGRFDVDDVCRGIAEKMRRRHPHVFGDRRLHDGAEVQRSWERDKVAQRRRRDPDASLLGTVPRTMPALLVAHRLSDKAAAVGFDWPDVRGILDKVREETVELAEAVAAGERAGVEHEFGDLLFALANLGRHLDVNPEDALREANGRFAARFAHVERSLRERGSDPARSTLDEMERLWQEAKEMEGAAGDPDGG